MKLLFAIKTMDSRGGGAERVLAQVTAELASRGHEVTLVSFDPPGSADFYAIDPAIRRMWLNAGRQNSSTNAFDLAHRTIRLRRALIAASPDVAIGFMHSAYVPLALGAAITRVPVVASEHIVFEHYRDRPLERLALRVVAPLLAAVTAVSESMIAGFPKPLARKMVVIPNPVGVLTEPPSQEARRPLILSVGRLEKQKDHATLIKAFASIAPRHPDWILRIVGEGSLRGRLEQLIDELGLESRVQAPGALSDVATEYSRAAVFAVPSRYESLGLATVEALSAGLPVIGFADCAGTNELIEDNVNGLLLSSAHKTSALAEGLDRLIGDSELRARLSKAGALSVSQFSLDTVVSQWEALLDAVRRSGPAGETSG